MRGHGTFVVDMSLTRFCDSAGLQALVAAHRRARAEDGEMLLVIPDAAVLRVFAITGMDRVIPNFARLAEALAHAPAARAAMVTAGHADRPSAGDGDWSLAGPGEERSDDATISPARPR